MGLRTEEAQRLAELAQQRAQLADAEIRELRDEVERSHATLDTALRSVGSLTHDKKTLAQQVAELVGRYERNRDTLSYLLVQLQLHVAAVEDAVHAREEATGELERLASESKETVRALEESARQERDAIVKAALRSLQLLRSHVAQKVQPPPPPAYAEGGGGGAAAPPMAPPLKGGGAATLFRGQLD